MDTLYTNAGVVATQEERAALVLGLLTNKVRRSEVLWWWRRTRRARSSNQNGVCVDAILRLLETCRMREGSRLLDVLKPGNEQLREHGLCVRHVAEYQLRSAAL